MVFPRPSARAAILPRMFDFFANWKDERFIRKVLRRLARQRVGMILQPGNVWQIDYAVSESEGEQVACALRTCHMRGWVEPISDSMPTGTIRSDGKLPLGNPLPDNAPLYRLTDSGWNVIHDMQFWVLVTCFVAVISVFVSLAGIVVTVAVSQ
jgi:hypothetical protein